ncbi:radical SAM family heme chaperone HemW [Luteimonas vadosa]|uniref:Heme chaperone HemW n=1 Tax=Luteimonas vadosa TaxID=1165507 RepID=A0ABP9DTS1_9GAMM
MLTPPPLSLYVHLPWCVRKCPYCDFNSHEFRAGAGAAAPPFNAYVEALLADLDHDLPLAGGRPIHSIFFGGGTPSLFPADAIDAFLHGAAARLSFVPSLEITLETNPGTTEHGRFEDYRRAGVNRLSFGIQSFDDGVLARLGRIHDSAEAEAAVRLAQDAGFDNINLDLMYALPGQDLAMAEHDVERALALQPTHLSHYQLTLEPNTLFAARPPGDLPDDDLAWEMQLQCQGRIAAAGHAQYEVSAYAPAGRECAHNLNYWRFGDYLGIGAGAHGKLTDAAGGIIRRRWKHKHPSAWLATAGTDAAIGGDESVADAQRPFEFMLNALRLVEGFRFSDYEDRTGLHRSTIAAPLAIARERDWLDMDRDAAVPTELGRRFGNDLISLFLDGPRLAPEDGAVLSSTVGGDRTPTCL